jgi:hypothetical protein
MLKAETGEDGSVEFKEVKTTQVSNPETGETTLKATECQ